MKLIEGQGAPGKGACWMSAIHYYDVNGASWSDQPECVDPVIRSLCIKLNDMLDSDAERERIIGPHLFTPMGTNLGKELTVERDRWCALQVAHLWDAPECVMHFLRTGEGAEESYAATYGYPAAAAATYAAAAAVLNAANAAAAATYAAATYAADAATAKALGDWDAKTIMAWILHLCDMGKSPEAKDLDPIRLEKTMREACLVADDER